MQFRFASVIRAQWSNEQYLAMKFFIYLVAVVAVLGALFVLFKPSGEAPVTQVKEPASSTVAGAPNAAPAAPAAAPAIPNATPAVPSAAQPPSAAPSPSNTAPAPPSAAPTSAAGTTTPPASAPAAAPAPQVFALTIRRGRLVDGPTVIKVHKNDEVVIYLTADVADELHLHGYDLNIKMRPGEKATLRFNATKTGRFGYELHHAKADLGALEVYPR